MEGLFFLGGESLIVSMRGHVIDVDQRVESGNGNQGLLRLREHENVC